MNDPLCNLRARPWMKFLLAAAGAYNLIWGAAAILLTSLSMRWHGWEPTDQSAPLWQGMGMLIGLYGLGYLLAAKDPFRHWVIVLVGLLSKVLSPIAFLWGYWQGTVPPQMGVSLIFNDLIWWVPLFLILAGAARYYQAEGTAYLIDEFDDPIRELHTSTGQSLWELSFDRPQLVVFLRHAGCTFCREALSDLQRQRPDIERAGCGIVLVHPSSQKCGDDLIEKYDLDDLPHLSDPQCRLYRQFGLEHALLRQIFGVKVLLRGLVAAIFCGHGFGKLQGNALQMPGAFLIHRGQFLRGFRHSLACDRLDYSRFVREALPVGEEERVAT